LRIKSAFIKLQNKRFRKKARRYKKTDFQLFIEEMLHLRKVAAKLVTPATRAASAVAKDPSKSAWYPGEV
jgi:hypothetical protein